MGTLRWLVQMQYYFVPTRGLDWSSSPFIALYFASQDMSCDGKIWISDMKKQQTARKEEYKKMGNIKRACTKVDEDLTFMQNFESFCFNSNFKNDFITFTNAFSTNVRIEAQQGMFSI